MTDKVYDSTTKVTITVPKRRGRGRKRISKKPEVRYGPFSRPSEDEIPVSGDFLLVEEYRVAVYDIGKRNNPKFISYNDPLNPALRMVAPTAALNAIGYADATPLIVSGSNIVSQNLINPKVPVQLDSLQDPSWYAGPLALDFATGDRIASLGAQAQNNDVMKLFDVSDPTDIILLDTANLDTDFGVAQKGCGSVIVLNNGLIYVINQHTFTPIQIPEDQEPSYLGVYDTTSGNISQLGLVQIEPHGNECTDTPGDDVSCFLGDGALYVFITMSGQGTLVTPSDFSLPACLACINLCQNEARCFLCPNCIACLVGKVDLESCVDCEDCIGQCITSGDCSGECEPCAECITECLTDGGCVETSPAQSKLLTYSLANPSTPTLVSSINLESLGLVCINKSKTRMYIINSFEGISQSSDRHSDNDILASGIDGQKMLTFSLHPDEGGSPTSPLLLSSINLQAFVDDIIISTSLQLGYRSSYATDDGWLYVGAMQGTIYERIHVFDVRGTTPVLAKDLDIHNHGQTEALSIWAVSKKGQNL